MQSQSQGSLTVVFVTAPDGAAVTGGTAGPGALNLGAVSYAAGPRTTNVHMLPLEGRFIVDTRFGMSIQDPSQRFSTATVLAFMARPEAFFTLRLDGMKLGTTPQVIQGQARLGGIVQHRLEIEVPTSLTEKNSQLQNSIVFQVIPN
jgi:hypothetical protein